MRGILLGVSDVLEWLLWAYKIVIFVAVAASWLSADPGNPIVRAIRRLTEPVFGWLRRALPFLSVGGIDFAPVAALLVCLFLDKALVFNLRVWAAGF